MRTPYPIDTDPRPATEKKARGQRLAPMTRAETLALQRAINAEFGWGLREDGVYGPKTGVIGADLHFRLIQRTTTTEVLAE